MLKSSLIQEEIVELFLEGDGVVVVVEVGKQRSKGAKEQRRVVFYAVTVCSLVVWPRYHFRVPTLVLVIKAIVAFSGR